MAELKALESASQIMNTGVLAAIAAIFLFFVWKLGNRWLASQEAKEKREAELEKQKMEKEASREDQNCAMLKTITTVAERSNAVIESNSRVIEGNQKVLEQVIQSNREQQRVQKEISSDLEKVSDQNSKIYTALKVMLDRGDKGA